MRYNKFLLCTIAFLCLGSQAYAQPDYLGGDSSGIYYDEGLAGMLQWLYTPVPSFPWYSPDVSFYRQGVPDTTFSPYREYYTAAGTPISGGIISNPVKFDITKEAPASVYYGTGQGLPFSQYASLVPSKANELWIRGVTNWTQYAVSPVGTWLQLVANAPVGGTAGFYEVVQTETIAQKYGTYQFSTGYSTMNIYADQAGRYMLYFVVNNQPSNVVIIDVFGQAQPGTGITGGNTGAIPIGGQSYYTPIGQATTIPNGLTTTTSNGQTTTTTSNGVTTTTSSSGDVVTYSNGQTTVSSDGEGSTVTSSYD